MHDRLTTGFNGGHSAAGVLYSTQHVTVRSFDVGAYGKRSPNPGSAEPVKKALTARNAKPKGAVKANIKTPQQTRRDHPPDSPKSDTNAATR